MNVFITGINGFIGCALARTLFDGGHAVTGSVSSSEKISTVPKFARGRSVIRLNEDVDDRVFQNVNALVHCAYDLRKGQAANNLQGTKKIAHAAAAQGVQSQIFIGSYSAHEQASSEYGRSKLELEKFFLEMDQIVVKPGLVIGHGGLFLKMCNFFQSYPFVPLIGTGKGKLPIIDVDDLTTSLTQLVERPRPGCYRLWNAEEITLRELLAGIKTTVGSKAVLLPVPVEVMYFGLWLSDKLGLPFQVDIGNLKGFQANQSVTDSSDLIKFVQHPSRLSEMLSSAFSSLRLPNG